MLKKITTIFIIFISSGLLFSVPSYAESDELLTDNILIKAFEERKNKLFEIITWGELTQEINNLELELNSLENLDELNKEIKDNLLKDIWNIKLKIEETKNQTENVEGLVNLINEAEQAIIIKDSLILNLDSETEENNLNKEKIKVLLDKYSKEKIEYEKKENEETILKYYLFFSFTLFLALIYFLSNFLAKKEIINKKRLIYLNFFLIFWYTIFLIWFFFYLHPELSIFIIFISGYLLAINAHLIASFVWSILILEKYKIWDIIKVWEYKWQIVKITTINTILLPMSDEWIFANKPIVIPNVDLLKETVIKDNNPESYIHVYTIKFDLSLWLDVIAITEYIENNILIKHLNNRLNTITWSDESFRSGHTFDRFWRININFTWRWDDLLNKKIERKIMWYFTNMVKVEKEKRSQEEKLEKSKELE